MKMWLCCCFCYRYFWLLRYTAAAATNLHAMFSAVELCSRYVFHLAERFCSGRYFCFRCYGFTKCEVTRVLLRSRALPARNGAAAAGNPCSPRGQYSLAGMFPIDIKIDLRE